MEVTPEKRATRHSSRVSHQKETVAEGQVDASPAVLNIEAGDRARKRGKEVDDEVLDMMRDPSLITEGLKIRKQFGLEYFEGTVMTGPFLSDTGDDTLENCWHIQYEDGDEEDLTLEEVLQGRKDFLVADRQANKRQCVGGQDSATESGEVIANGRSSRRIEEKEEADTATKKIKTALDELEHARRDLKMRVGLLEKEVDEALKKMKPPYHLNRAVQLIHEARQRRELQGLQLDEDEDEQEGKFNPHVGMRVRKVFFGAQYYGRVTREPESVFDEDGTEVKMWEVTYDDGDKDDMDYMELFQCRASRPIRMNPVRGRQLCALEIFSGCGIVTQEFAERKWRVRSVDNDIYSKATNKVDIMKLRYEDIGMIPDFLWTSPPCFTYSLMAGGKHRSPHEGLFEKTPEARENNRYLTRLFFLMRWARKHNPHLIVVIENPMGLLQKMPLMAEMVDSFGLYVTTVHYCAFGRDDKKPTQLWTNDFGLHATLSKFTCKETCPYYGGCHPISPRQHGSKFNSAAIPQPLAEEVAEHVHAKMYMDRIRYTRPKLLSPEEEEEFNQVMRDDDFGGRSKTKTKKKAQSVTPEEEESAGKADAEEEDTNSFKTSAEDDDGTNASTSNEMDYSGKNTMSEGIDREDTYDAMENKETAVDGNNHNDDVGVDRRHVIRIRRIAAPEPLDVSPPEVNTLGEYPEVESPPQEKTVVETPEEVPPTEDKTFEGGLPTEDDTFGKAPEQADSLPEGTSSAVEEEPPSEGKPFEETAREEISGTYNSTPLELDLPDIDT